MYPKQLLKRIIQIFDSPVSLFRDKLTMAVMTIMYIRRTWAPNTISDLGTDCPRKYQGLSLPLSPGSMMTVYIVLFGSVYILISSSFRIQLSAALPFHLT
jgi:hypothetical protein